jgi:DNA invertase Pin-like site-specific DNA recombinase
MEIVRTYADEGRSGLSLDGREALTRLICDVQTGKADFTAILVYDVSRWGRFQDPDESAYHEYLCKRAGIRVHYCAEQFENDGSPFAAIVKAIKRAMAGEYSRELSAKVFAGQSRLIKLGYRQGASAAYGFRRLLVDERGIAKQVLAPGELKSIQADRVVLIQGPEGERDIVRWIFKTFTKQRKNEREIAELLNERKIAGIKGGPWAPYHVRRILTNENYIGNVVWNRQSVKLKGKLTNNRPDQWVRVEGVVEATIERLPFNTAQEILRSRKPGLTEQQKLEPLRRLLRRRGTLSAQLINGSRTTPSASAYYRWFGGLTSAYERIGFKEGTHRRDGRPRRSQHAVTRGLSDQQLLDMLKQLYEVNGYLTRTMINQADGMPSAGTYTRRFGGVERAYELIGLPWIFPNRPPRRPHRSTVSLSDAQLLDALRKLLRQRGFLSQKIINETARVPAVATYRRRFGGITAAYDLIGYTAPFRAARSQSQMTRSLSNEELLEKLRKLRRKHGHLSARLIDEAKGIPATSTYLRRFGSLAEACQLTRNRPKRLQ